MSGFSPEQRLVIDAVRHVLSDRPESPIPAIVDWRLTLMLADRQGLAPYLLAAIKAFDPPPSPRFVAAIRARSLSAEAKARDQRAPHYRRVLTQLIDAGLRPVVLKGAALAELVYPAPYFRTMSDLDLLLPDRQAWPAAELLGADGFVTRATDLPATHHLLPLYRGDCPHAIELHHRLLVEQHPYLIDLDGLHARARPVRVVGVDTLALAPEDALLHVCVHAASSHRYSYSPLRGLVDILAMTSRWRDELDWGWFVNQVRRSRTAGGVYWPLRLSQRWLGAPVPASVLQALAPPRPLGRMVAALIQPDFVLGDARPPRKRRDTMEDLLLTASLTAGCPPWVLAGALLRALFQPPTDEFGHPILDGADWRTSLYMLRPSRFTRGLAALGRLRQRAGWPGARI